MIVKISSKILKNQKVTWILAPGINCIRRDKGKKKNKLLSKANVKITQNGKGGKIICWGSNTSHHSLGPLRATWACVLRVSEVILRESAEIISMPITLGWCHLSLLWSQAGWRFSSRTAGDTLTGGRYLLNPEWQ